MAASKQWSKTTFIYNMIAPVIIFPALMLLLGGDWRWLEGWLFGLWMAAMIIVNVAYQYLHDPALLAERSKLGAGDNQKRWDRIMLPLALVMALSWLVIMPLDAQRFNWSPEFPIWVKVIGGIMLLPALYLLVRPTKDNTFLSARVRIQEEREQRVITTGTYSFVRHPLYLGAVLMIFGAPLLLGSLFGLGIGLFAAASLVARIIGEEKMLVEDLPGYGAYRQKVKYRLIPYIW